jgi:hypothetical protein
MPLAASRFETSSPSCLEPQLLPISLAIRLLHSNPPQGLSSPFRNVIPRFVSRYFNIPVARVSLLQDVCSLLPRQILSRYSESLSHPHGWNYSQWSRVDSRQYSSPSISTSQYITITTIISSNSISFKHFQSQLNSS